ncbi:hypothetical protein GCM10009115_14970 [Sphingopyxis soli]|uniref:YdhG-like domain-containing protein n=1 Tax=Sphingopyxis soli TaxID=592051 RepID=A0ABN1M3A5_9SPHN
MSRDPRVDAYIAAAQPFAQPILKHLRKLVHDHAPGAEETLKWGVPHFVLGGQNLADMAAFKGHATFGFWRDEEVTGSPRDTGAMGSMGRLATLADLPSDEQLAAWIAKGGGPLCRNEAEATQARAETGARPARRPRRGAGGRCRRAGPVGRLLARQSPRLYRMGAGGEARTDARETHRDDRRAGRRGQGPQLEVQELLTLSP